MSLSEFLATIIIIASFGGTVAFVICICMYVHSKVF